METDNSIYYKYSESGIKKRNYQLWENINNINIEVSFKEKFYLYENNLNEAPKCYCGNLVKFIDMTSGYREFCSKKCMYNSEDVKNKKIKTNLEKWGVDNPSKSEKIKDKVKQTNLEKFGVEYPLQSEKIKEKVKTYFINKCGVDNPSKLKEVRDKATKTMIEKWGVEHAMLSPEIRLNLKKYFLEKWGVDNPSKLKEVRDKATKTMIEKWGVSYPLQNVDILKKLKNTNLKKWGFESATQNEEVKNKTIKTNLKKWGVDNPSKNEEIKNKTKLNNIEKWGVDNPSKLKEIKDKIQNTNIKNWNTTHIFKSEDYRMANYNIAKNENYIKYIKDGISLFKCDNGFDHNFEIHIDNYIHRINIGKLCTICYPIGDNTSISEKMLFDYIKSIYNGDIIESYRDGLEIDIYLPELKLGFEFNGLYWHSEKFKDRNYHLNKTNYFKERGIRIIHIWEDDWVYKNDIIRSQIANWIGISDKIYARKCTVKEVTNKEIISFLNANHIQGFINAKVSIGLFYNNELVSIMSFDKYEGRNKMNSNGWNLNRFCNKLNITVIGSASRLLSYFIKSYNPHRIISYADKNWSTGDLYKKLGFIEIKNTEPDYKYIVDGKRKHKSGFRKSNLNTNLSESQEMKNKNIFKIWDCGKIKFELLK